MRDVVPIQVAATAVTLPEALTAALRQIIAHFSSPESAGTLAGTIQAEAASAAGLLPQLTASLAGLIDDFETTPLDISIDGVRWLDDTMRAWGTVTLGRERLQGPVEIDWLEASTVEQTEDGWRIEGEARIAPPQIPQDL